MKQVSLSQVIVLLLEHDVTVSKIALALHIPAEQVIAAIFDVNGLIGEELVIPILHAYCPDAKVLPIIGRTKVEYLQLAFSLKKELLNQPLSSIFQGKYAVLVGELKRKGHEKVWEFAEYSPKYIDDLYGLGKLPLFLEMSEALKLKGIKSCWKFSREETILLKELSAQEV